jgi:hypothetical protein
MAGHEGIEGNELTDSEAKEVAKGCTTDTKLLPHYLRKPLVINSSAAKKAHNESLTTEWRET